MWQDVTNQGLRPTSPQENLVLDSRDMVHEFTTVITKLGISWEYFEADFREILWQIFEHLNAQYFVTENILRQLPQFNRLKSQSLFLDNELYEKTLKTAIYQLGTKLYHLTKHMGLFDYGFDDSGEFHYMFVGLIQFDIVLRKLPF